MLAGVELVDEANWDTKVRVNQELAIQTISGPTTGELLRSATADLASVCETYRISRIIMNVRESDAIFTPPEFIAMFEGFMKAFPGVKRVAYVLDPDSHDLEQMLLETMAWNFGVEIMFVAELQAAEAWILGTRPG